MRALILFLLLTGAALADSRNNSGVMHYWKFTATGTSASASLINSTDPGPYGTTGGNGGPSSYGPAKAILIIPASTGPDVVFNLVATTANATPTNGGNNIALHAGSAPYSSNGVWPQISYISTGANQTFEVVTIH